MFRNGLNMYLPLQAWVKKIVHGMEAYRLSGKEKVPGAAVSKDCHFDSFLGDKRTHNYWFPWKRYNCTLPIANSFGKIHHIYWMTLTSFNIYMCIYIYIYIYIYREREGGRERERYEQIEIFHLYHSFFDCSQTLGH